AIKLKELKYDHRKPKDNNIVEFLSIDSLDYKISSFDLNPLPPSFNLRFRSNKWNISTTFDASRQMLLSDLKDAIIEHFDILSSINLDLSQYQHFNGVIMTEIIVRINGKDYL